MSALRAGTWEERLIKTDRLFGFIPRLSEVDSMSKLPFNTNTN